MKCRQRDCWSLPYGTRKTASTYANLYKRNKTKHYQTNIYIKKMGDKTNQNKRNRRTQSKRRDQRTFHHSYPEECWLRVKRKTKVDHMTGRAN